MIEEEIITNLKYIIHCLEDTGNFTLYAVAQKDSMQGLLDLYYKQQKEIEHLKIEKEVDYISKDKIREKMKEIEEIQNMAFTDIGQAVYNAEIVLLKRLLEE